MGGESRSKEKSRLHKEILSDTYECIHLAQCKVGRTARLGERGDSLLYLQPVEIDYLKDLERHGVLLTEYPLLKLLDSLPLYGHNQHVKKFISLEMHPWALSLQKALESFIYREPSVKKLAMDAFCSRVRAYSAREIISERRTNDDPILKEE